MHATHRPLAVAVALGLAVLAACGGDDDSGAPVTAAPDTGGPVATAAGADTSATGGSYQALAPADADALLRDPPAGLVLLDVRTPEEYAAGHIEGAIDIDFEGATFVAEVAELDRDVPYLVYCRTARRSGLAVEYMRQQGFTSLYELTDGIVAWQEAGLPVVTG